MSKIFLVFLVFLVNISQSHAQSISHLVRWNSTKLIDQFKTYLQNPDGFQYWFNGLKDVNATIIKNGFKKLYQKPNMWSTLTNNANPPAIPPSWLDPMTPGSIIDNETKFLAAINDYNSKLYQLINIQ